MRQDLQLNGRGDCLSSATLRKVIKRTQIVMAVTAAAAVTLFPARVSAQNSWLATRDVQNQLDAGKVVSQTQLDEQHKRAQTDAAIRIDAAPQTIWQLLTDCMSAAIYIPGLKHCRVLDSAADGSWAVIEHDIKYSALLPTIHSVYRADYRAPQRIDFHGISGNLKDETGAWILREAADHTVTVEYKVSIRPDLWVPRSMIQRSLKKQLPAALVALRSHAERIAALAATATNRSAPSTPPVATPEGVQRSPD